MTLTGTPNVAPNPPQPQTQPFTRKEHINNAISLSVLLTLGAGVCRLALTASAPILAAIIIIPTVTATAAIAKSMFNKPKTTPTAEGNQTAETDATPAPRLQASLSTSSNRKANAIGIATLIAVSAGICSLALTASPQILTAVIITSTVAFCMLATIGMLADRAKIEERAQNEPAATRTEVTAANNTAASSSQLQSKAVRYLIKAVTLIVIAVITTTIGAFAFAAPPQILAAVIITPIGALALSLAAGIVFEPNLKRRNRNRVASANNAQQRLVSPRNRNRAASANNAQQRLVARLLRPIATAYQNQAATLQAQLAALTERNQVQQAVIDALRLQIEIGD